MSRLAVIVPLMMGSAAHARAELSVTGSLSAKESSNPFLVDDDDAQSAAVSLTLSPNLTMTQAEGTISLDLTVRATEYTRRYASSKSAFSTARADWALDARTRLNASLGYSDSITGENNYFPTEVGDIPVLEDITLNGFRTRQRQINSSLGVNHRLSARDRIGMQAFASSSDFKSKTAGTDYASYGGNVSWDRELNSATFAGLSMGLSKFECRSGTACSSTVVSPQATFSTTLWTRWALTASGGVSINKLRFPGDRTNSVDLSGSFSLCRQDPRTNICFSGNRAVSQTSIAGPRTGTTLAASVQHRLNQSQNIGASFGYAESGAGRLGTSNFRYWNARINGNTRLWRNVGLTIDGAYLHNRSPINGQRSNVEVSMGINFALGKDQ